MTELQNYIFIGRSGSGKGTQAKLLVEHLQAIDSERTVFHLETGQFFRNLLAQSTFTAQLARERSARGERQPDFLAIALWTTFLLEKFTGREHLVFDGSPRSLAEAQALDAAFAFYNREKPKVIFLNVSDERVLERLLARGRPDDSEDGIKKRLAWYEQDVAPVIDYYRQHSGYQFLSVDGSRSVELIQAEIRKTL